MGHQGYSSRNRAKNIEFCDSLDIKRLSNRSQLALDIIEDAASELKADAIVFKSAPSDVQIRHGPLRADAIQFLPVFKAPHLMLS